MRIIKSRKKICLSTKKKPSPESIVREIKRKTRRKYSAEEKIRIVLEGLRGEQSITDLCQKEGIHPGIYYKWSKAFLEAGKQRLTGDTVREAGSEEFGELRTENEGLWDSFAFLGTGLAISKFRLLLRAYRSNFYL